MVKEGPRLRDVAQAAGVSVATASKARNGRQDGAPAAPVSCPAGATPPTVRAVGSPAARAWGMRAARGLPCRPRRAAQQLPGGPSGTVGLIANDLDGTTALWRLASPCPASPGRR